METTYDWSKFCKRIPVKASVQDLYDAWTVPIKLEKWFLRSASFKHENGMSADSGKPVTKGDTYYWMWHGYTDDIFEEGEVLEANGKNMFRFVFGNAGIVKVLIREESMETIVELWQEHIPTDDKHKAMYHVGCMEGWTFYLANLKSVMEGGLDLRNKNILIKRVVNS